MGGSPYFQLYVLLVLVWHRSLFSGLSIYSQLFNIYTIQGIMYSMIRWHGLRSIRSNLYAFILRAAH